DIETGKFWTWRFDEPEFIRMDLRIPIGDDPPGDVPVFSLDELDLGKSDELRSAKRAARTRSDRAARIRAVKQAQGAEIEAHATLPLALSATFPFSRAERGRGENFAGLWKRYFSSAAAAPFHPAPDRPSGVQ